MCCLYYYTGFHLIEGIKGDVICTGTDATDYVANFSSYACVVKPVEQKIDIHFVQVRTYSAGQHNLNSLQINGQPINDTKEAHHIGLLHADTIAKTMEINVE
jgi:hypothetical protein